MGSKQTNESGRRTKNKTKRNTRVCEEDIDIIIEDKDDKETSSDDIDIP